MKKDSVLKWSTENTKNKIIDVQQCYPSTPQVRHFYPYSSLLVRNWNCDPALRLLIFLISPLYQWLALWEFVWQRPEHWKFMVFAFFRDKFACSIFIFFCMSGSFCILNLPNIWKLFGNISKIFAKYLRRFCQTNAKIAEIFCFSSFAVVFTRLANIFQIFSNIFK